MLERIREVITKYDGFIERFSGDGVLAPFGVTKSHEHVPVTATRSVLAIHELVKAKNPTYEAKANIKPWSHEEGLDGRLNTI